MVWCPPWARGLSTYQSVVTVSGIHSATNSVDARGFSPRVKRPGREANQLRMLALWMSGSFPLLPIRLHDVHRDIFILILMFNVTAIRSVYKFTSGFIRLMFLVRTQRLCLDVRTEISNVSGELPEPTALSWCSNGATDYSTDESALICTRARDFIFSRSSISAVAVIQPLLTGTESSLAAGPWSWPHACSAECVEFYHYSPSPSAFMGDEYLINYGRFKFLSYKLGSILF